ncbi:MAG TPA: M24 family metallopeptidase, partial [Thermomicrobiales bacterium]|nr:M24 family metallopeptidase [Thermomicrobiales bacterium]
MIGATGTETGELGISDREFAERRSKARFLAGLNRYAALLVVGRSFYDRPGDLAYLSNHFPPFPTAVFSEGNAGLGHGFLLLPAEGDPVLLTDPRRHRADLVDITDVRAAPDLGQAVIDLLRERSLEASRIGLVGDDILPAALDRRFAREMPDLELGPERGIVASLRRIKSHDELALLRKAARCADSGLQAAHTRFQSEGATERVVAASGTAQAIEAGADFVRYFRVHSGPWSAAGSRWPPAMDRIIGAEEVAVVDVIGAHRGYHFDVNRTFGRPELDP